MQTSDTAFDALVVGAGAGGLFAAARLAHAGYRTLVVERLDKVGGRASTTEIDGFLVNDGAIVIEVGGITEETFAEVGAEFDIRTPKVPVLYRVGGKNLDVTRGGWGMLLSQLTRQGAKLLSGIGAARTNDDALPGGELSHRGVGRQVLEERGRAGRVPQHVRLGVRRRVRGAARSGVPHLLHPQVGVQEVRVLPGRHDRGLAVAGELGDRQRRPGVAVVGGRAAAPRRRPGHRCHRRARRRARRGHLPGGRERHRARRDRGPGRRGEPPADYREQVAVRTGRAR